MDDDLEAADLQYVLPFVADPPLQNAPPWAQELAHRQSRDRHALRNAMTVLRAELKRDTHSLHVKLGKEPNSDGSGGEGLIGDFRKVTADVRSLMDLRSKGLGFIAAVALFGALIMLGVVQFIQNVTHAK